MMPRVHESSLIFSQNSAIDYEFLRSSFREPLQRAFGWIYVFDDRSPHKTVGPGANSIEAVLFTAGLLLLLTDGISLNVLVLPFAATILLFAGAWATSPPQYSRLALMTPVVALCAARSLSGVASLFPEFTPFYRRMTLYLLTAITVFISPCLNMKRYLDYETGNTPQNAAFQASSIGRHLMAYPDKYDYYFMISKRSDWSFNGGTRFAEIIPYIWNLQVHEIRDINSISITDLTRPSAFVFLDNHVPESFLEKVADQVSIAVEPIKDFRGQEVASVLLIDPSQRRK